jgi:hypothetical protein
MVMWVDGSLELPGVWVCAVKEGCSCRADIPANPPFRLEQPSCDLFTGPYHFNTSVVVMKMSKQRCAQDACSALGRLAPEHGPSVRGQNRTRGALGDDALRRTLGGYLQDNPTPTSEQGSTFCLVWHTRRVGGHNQRHARLRSTRLRVLLHTLHLSRSRPSLWRIPPKDSACLRGHIKTRARRTVAQTGKRRVSPLRFLECFVPCPQSSHHHPGASG